MLGTMKAALALGAAGALIVLFPAAGHTGHTVIWFNGNDAPAWSPNGSLIAYTAFRGKKGSEIYLMRPNGTARHDVTNHPGYDDLAVWSPDSSRIAFTSNRSGDDE